MPSGNSWRSQAHLTSHGIRNLESHCHPSRHACHRTPANGTTVVGQSMSLIEQIRELIQSAARDRLSGGQFGEVVTVEDGRQITYQFPLATGMAWQAKKSSYLRRFGDLPTWAQLLHPVHRISLCNLSLDVGLPLPQAIEEETIAPYLATAQSAERRVKAGTARNSAPGSIFQH